jgi:UvrD-like helicase C-terminal domain
MGLKDDIGGYMGKLSSETPSREFLVETAKQILDYFAETAANARAQLLGSSGLTVSSLATMNTLTAASAVRNLAMISESRQRDLIRLRDEPAIARVVVLEDNREKRTIFVARAPADPVPGRGVLAVSYRSPMGRLATIPVGEDVEVKTPGGLRTFEVLERAALRPMEAADQWDSVNLVVHGQAYGPLTIVSLRALLHLEGPQEEEADLLERLLEQDRVSSNVIEGLRRAVIEKMGLRDQPLLDQYQDTIFRLPLDRRLAILGPPGSGKTTTLIKRLGLKLDQAHLEEDERLLVERSLAGPNGHAGSWLMFTPTELLKQYVKEAFARENIPASDLRIKTWSDYRRELARNKLGVLRTASRGGFVLRDGLRSIKDETISQQTAWFADFEGWQASLFWSELDLQAERLSEDSEPTIAALGARLMEVVNSADSVVEPAPFLAFHELNGEVSTLIANLRTEVDANLRRAFAQELKRENRLLDDLLAFLGTLGEPSDPFDELEDPEADEEEEEEEETRPHRGEREKAFGAYKRAVRAQARATVLGRNVGRRSRSGRILEWLGPRSLPEAECFTVGRKLQVQAALRRFVNPLRRYIHRMPARYRSFRRERQAQGIWYCEDSINQSELNPLEVDAILLGMLRGAGALLKDRWMLSRFPTLETFHELYRTQIVVDEATDFSPLQLTSMTALCDPSVQSFLACGDFHQRTTEWGCRSVDELKWALPDIDIRSIHVTYRHSRQLNELAHRIVALAGPDAPEAQLPAYVNNEGVSPVLGKSITGHRVVEWLAERIVEIERFSDRLPSIAVLVNGEDQVRPLAEALNEILSKQNIRVIACPEGQAVGQENDIRIFDVQHIKGLEFEAVFFVAVDELAVRQPQLFDKYLYVGTTRAATYLGITCASAELPSRLGPLATMFAASWR